MSQSTLSLILQNGSQYLAGIMAGCITGAKVFPHTLGLPKYKSFVQLYDKGFEVKLDEHTKQLAQEVLDAMNMKEEMEARVELFVAYGQDMVSKGSLNTRKGGIVGIPANFKYLSTDNVERNKVVLNNKGVDWNSSAGEKLAEAMVLSDNAKKFAIAREIFTIKSYFYAVDALLASFSFLGSYSFGYFINRKMGLREKLPMVVRGGLYTGFACLGLLTYVLVRDAYNCRQDRKLDQKAGTLMPALALGGVEYYTKLLQRNIALRELLGNSGSSLYTAYGNVTQSWRTPKLSLTAHRDLMIRLVEEYNNSSNKMGDAKETEHREETEAVTG
ncbi:transmembrane protein 177-like [Liolophura sinensis]|uniref:transmembrane protein 177-like n=1 Tax=Liolophura sinensis TaxID=3198878 RepID=UPI0031587E9A